jgi:hypothetical protein
MTLTHHAVCAADVLMNTTSRELGAFALVSTNSSTFTDQTLLRTECSVQKTVQQSNGQAVFGEYGALMSTFETM